MKKKQKNFFGIDNQDTNYRWAGSKIKQLSVAKNLGFNIPKTYIGNNKEELVNQFNTDSIAIKPISEDWIDYKNTLFLQIWRNRKNSSINYVQEYIQYLN